MAQGYSRCARKIAEEAKEVERLAKQPAIRLKRLKPMARTVGKSSKNIRESLTPYLLKFPNLNP
ncbi:MAG: hypothetical protein QXD69_06470 [Candidatus Bathyarchaeia archaeon]